MADFYDWLAHYAERRPEHTAAHDLASKRAHSYAALHARTDALARHLQENLQIQPEDRVGVLCHNTTDSFEMQFASGALKRSSCRSTGVWRRAKSA